MPWLEVGRRGQGDRDDPDTLRTAVRRGGKLTLFTALLSWLKFLDLGTAMWKDLSLVQSGKPPFSWNDLVHVVQSKSRGGTLRPLRRPSRCPV